MKIKKLLTDSRLLNEELGGDPAGAGSANPAPSGSESNGSNGSQENSDFENLKTNYSTLEEKYNNLNETLSSINPKLGVLDKLEGLFNPQTAEEKRKFDEVNMLNVTDVAEEAYRRGELTTSEIAELRNEINELKSERQMVQYQQSVADMETAWVSDPETAVFPDQESYTNFLNRIGKEIPQLEQALNQYQAEGKAPPPEFIDSLNREIERRVLRELRDPNSEISKQRHRIIERKAALSKSSVMEGDGYRAGSGNDDGGFITTTYYS